MVRTLFPEPTNINQARRQANIITRAQTLIESGYQAIQRSRPTLYGIYKPENVKPVRGVWHSDYSVDTTPGRELCTCPSFKEDGDCKHRIAVAMREAEEANFMAQYAEWAAMMDGAECATGCDYRY